MRKKLKKLPWRQMSGALCIGLVALCFYLDTQQDALAEKMLRLHVLANSDTEADQALKLQVRDEILHLVEPWTQEVADVQAVAAVLGERQDELQACAQQVVLEAGYGYAVTVELGESFFPTRNYDGFSLPAGNYEALRVNIGEAAGENWWCVVFPPLCLSSTSESMGLTAEEAGLTAKEAGLTEQEVFLILEEEEEYVIKFRAIELWESLKHAWN